MKFLLRTVGHAHGSSLDGNEPKAVAAAPAFALAQRRIFETVDWRLATGGLYRGPYTVMWQVLVA